MTLSTSCQFPARHVQIMTENNRLLLSWVELGKLRVLISWVYECMLTVLRNTFRGTMGLDRLTVKLKGLTTSSGRHDSSSSSSTYTESTSTTERTRTSSTSSSTSTESSKDPRDKIVQVSKSDEGKYRVLTLKNGMRCMLISNGDRTKVESSGLHTYDNVSTTENAAACLSVQVGSAQDPKNIPGLAHFLEHMLFMGCTKYPNENEYDDYLAKHGGNSNATTDFELTQYMFDVSVEHFSGALDRFANQFISPLLKKNSVNREVNAVDSEYMETLQRDSERIQQITLSLLQPDHTFNRFACGNKKSILLDSRKRFKLDPLVELRKFYETFYSANIMCLCVESMETLDKLEEMVQIFEQIPNRNIQLPGLALVNCPLPKPRYNFVKYFPVKERNKIFISWYLPPQMKHYKTKPDDYVSWCIAHEGPESLLSKLKKEGLALSIEGGVAVGGCSNTSNFSHFEITMVLSELGLTRYRDVITYLFQYIAMMQKQLPQKWIQDEIRKMDQINYDYKEVEDPYDEVEALGENMTMYPPEHYISGPELTFEYKPELISAVLDQLQPDKMFVILQSKDFKLECKSQERWNRGQYHAASFPPEFIAELQQVRPAGFSLPSPNRYIPGDFELKDIDVDGPSPAPILIADSDKQKIWYHADDTFEQPECMIYIHIFSKLLCADIKAYTLNCFYLACISYQTEEVFYSAEEAGLSSALTPRDDGWNLSLNGYNDKMLMYFKAILKEYIDTNTVTESTFKIIKESMVKDYKMATLKPVKYAQQLRHQLLIHDMFSSEAKAAALQNIQLSDLSGYKMTDLGSFFIESLFGGNLTDTEAHEYMSELSEILKTNEKPLTKNQFPQTRAYRIPQGSSRMRVKNKNPEDVNTVVVNYYQHDIVTFRDLVLLRIVQDFMEEPMFNQLRTRLQLGYSVSASDHETHGVTGFSIVVETQASKFTATEINIYIEKFLSWFREYLVKMDEDSYSKLIASIIKSRLSSYDNLDNEMDQMWEEIVIREYIFDRDHRFADLLKDISKGEVVTFYHNLFFNSPRKLSVQVTGNPRGTLKSNQKSEGEESDSESDSDEEETPSQHNVLVPHMTKVSKNDIRSWPEQITDISSVSDFQKSCSLLPVYKLACEIVTKDVTNL